MIEQVGAGTTTKRRRSRLVSKQNGTQPSPSKRPTNDDKEAWKAYWKEKGQWWRIEPEIDGERQKYLADHRTITPDIQQGIYPFKNIEPRLSRADVEWLLATHENGRGPIDWSDEHQRNRKGLDLRGAILSTIDLSYLPLARTCGGLTAREWDAEESNQRELARIHLEGAHLFRAHLEGVDFSGANMEGADLSYIFMERSYLVEVHLEGVRLHKAHLEHAYLREAHLEGSHLTQAYLHEADLSLAACRRERTGSHASRSASACVIHGTGTSARTACGRKRNRVSESDRKNWKDAPIPRLRSG